MILIVDSHALIHRAFHAYPDTLILKDGTVINAVYGFASLLITAIEKLKPDQIICAFDTAATTFRRQEYSDYKAQRGETHANLIPQFSLVEDIVKAFDIQIAKLPGFEADDIIGTLAKKTAYKDKVIILTGDADEYQLLSENVSIFMAARSFKDSKVYTYTEIQNKLGFKPELLADYKALKGDSSDNIPGVAGIGEKVATELVSKFGTVEEIYKNIDQVEPKTQKKLLDQFELAGKFKSLTTIRTDVPLDVDFDKLIQHKFKDFDLEKVEKLFKEFEFRSLFERVRKLKINLKADNFPITSLPKKNLTTLNKGDFQNKEQFNFSDSLFDRSLNFEPFEAKDYFVGWDLKTYFKQNYPKYLEIKRQKFKTFDLMIASYLLNYSNSLEYNSAIYKFLDTTEVKENSQVELFHKLTELFESNIQLKSLFFELEMPISMILLEMERQGIHVDKEKLIELDKTLDTKMGELKFEIYKHIGHEFNVDSPKQIGEVLALEQGIPLRKKSKSGQYGTSAEDLEKYLGTNPAIEKILDYRSLSKLKSTYTTGLLKEIQPDLKIHTTYNQAQVATGRISSIAPNLQNIPWGDEYSDMIKSSFTSDLKNPDSYLVNFDYSQQEIRILAYLAEEQSLIDAFKNKVDIHKLTASKIYNVQIDQVTKLQRSAAKTVNFGVIYGIGQRALSIQLKISQDEARQIINNFYESYPAIKNYYSNLFENAKKNGYISTILGRRKNTEILNSSNKGIISQIEREIMNFPIQGSAADMTKLAMRDVSNYLTRTNLNSNIKLLLQVHDELVFEMNGNETKLKEISNEIREIMENVMPQVSNQIPIEVDYKIGKRWS